MNFNISRAPFPRAADLDFEVVERKGIGHPDTLCDAIAERASRYYSQFFMEKYNRYAHHWFDKVMLLGGQSDIAFGYGKLVHPYKVIYAGKAVDKVGTDLVPINDILYNAAADVLHETLCSFNAKDNLIVDIQLSNYIGPGQKKTRYNPESASDLFDPNSSERLSNDCNVCSGFAPLSNIERMVIEIEKYLSSDKYKSPLYDTGYDIKIVGIRLEKKYSLFINIPFIANKIFSRDQYLSRVSDLSRDVNNYVLENFGIKVNVNINPEKDSGRSYLTVTGSVADTGDVGVVGRGNRINGIITPMRPMSIEASSGKNPIDHTGKIYGILSQRIADMIFNDFNIESQVHLITFKEYPISKPENVFIYAHSDIDEITSNKIKTLIYDQLNSAESLTEEMVFSGITLW